MVVLVIWGSLPTMYNAWGHQVLLWEFRQLCSPMVIFLVSPEMPKHLWFLPLSLLAANFSRWHLTSSSVPPVDWTPHSPTSYGLNISLCFSPSLGWVSRSPEWAPYSSEHRVTCSSINSASTTAPIPNMRAAFLCHGLRWDWVQGRYGTVCTYVV